MGELASVSKALRDATKEPALSCGHCLKLSYLEQRSRVAISKRVPSILGWPFVLRTNHIIQACIRKALAYRFEQSSLAEWQPACLLGQPKPILANEHAPSSKILLPLNGAFA